MDLGPPLGKEIISMGRRTICTIVIYPTTFQAQGRKEGQDGMGLFKIGIYKEGK